MIRGGIKAFSGKRVLLLQGPVGPFFTRFARDLRTVGAQVWKVNFNAGDWLFYPEGITYRGTMEDWPRWFEAKVKELSIDTVFLFGDCRPIHRAAHEKATALGIEVGVFEEGYIRPDFVTLERSGVNCNSTIKDEAVNYRTVPPVFPARQSIPKPYWFMVWYGFLYFTIGGFGRGLFPHYGHHRPLTIMEMFPWIYSPIKKWWCAWKERGTLRRLVDDCDGRYFFVPLQVYNDAQVTCHSDFDSVARFIEETIASFARHAPQDKLLVLKHHPMDRGYIDYTGHIDQISDAAGCSDRVIYIHDQHTPTLINHACGVVTINSTVGLAALGQKCPTKVCGRSLYDIEGLTFQGSLDEFWTEGLSSAPDYELYRGFRDHLISRTQINGNFYRRLPGAVLHSGLAWSLQELDEKKGRTEESHVVPFPPASATQPVLTNSATPGWSGPETNVG